MRAIRSGHEVFYVVHSLHSKQPSKLGELFVGVCCLGCLPFLIELNLGVCRDGLLFLCQRTRASPKLRFHRCLGNVQSTSLFALSLFCERWMLLDLCLIGTLSQASGSKPGKLSEVSSQPFFNQIISTLELEAVYNLLLSRIRLIGTP